MDCTIAWIYDSCWPACIGIGRDLVGHVANSLIGGGNAYIVWASRLPFVLLAASIDAVVQRSSLSVIPPLDKCGS